MNFEDIETKEGVRLSWNVFPTTPSQEEALAIPIAALYTPTRSIEGLGQVEYKPVLCSQCQGILNPYSVVNYQNKTWLCPLCNVTNTLPKHYHAVTEQHRPAELMEEYTTLEYQINQRDQNPVFFYVVDIAVIPQELEAIKNAIRQSLSLLPDNALVGFITYGANIHLYELTFSYCPKSFTFSGITPTPTDQITQRLGLSFAQKAANAAVAAPNQPGSSNTQPIQPQSPTFPGKSRFLTPIADCEADLGTIIDHIQPDTWVYDDQTRPSRCTGLAVALALNVLEFLHNNQNARVLTLIGGAVVTANPPITAPPTQQSNKNPPPGQGGAAGTAAAAAAAAAATEKKNDTNQANVGEIASNNFADPLRSHHDIIKGEAPLSRPASDFYTKLASQAVTNRHVVDIFACCLDQVGVSEMYPLVTQTGGELILDDSFTRGVFQGSIKKILQRELVFDGVKNVPSGPLMMSFASELKVSTSPHLLINGGLGHCTNMNVPGPTTNMKNALGAGKTQKWYLGGLMPDSTFSVFFSINPSPPAKQLQQGPPRAFIQFVTTYKTATGSIVVRCTTIARFINDNPQVLNPSFDQEASVVAMSRLALHKLVLDPHQDIRRWLDRQLIKLCTRFATYTKDDANSFRLPPHCALYPQQMYYLRRSPLIQIFNSSPDETVFVRTIALRQDVSNTLTIIQPNLYSYDIASNSAQGEPVLLDSSQLSPKRILLLDTYFQIVIWYGQTVAQWKAREIWKEQQFEYIGGLIRQPLIDAKHRIESRLPTPRFIECVEGGSQARFMLARLNPSTQATVGVDGEAIAFTEDITLNVFLQHLKRLVVQNKKD